MSLSEQQKDDILSFLDTKIQSKLKKYSRESSSMPFLTRLMQNAEYVAAYSFIHSLVTTLGMSLYEEIAVILARESAEESFKKI